MYLILTHLIGTDVSYSARSTLCTERRTLNNEKWGYVNARHGKRLKRKRRKKLYIQCAVAWSGALLLCLTSAFLPLIRGVCVRESRCEFMYMYVLCVFFYRCFSRHISIIQNSISSRRCFDLAALALSKFIQCDT